MLLSVYTKLNGAYDMGQHEENGKYFVKENDKYRCL
jgi:hypothetical protein